jgi:hypothetical protein
MRTGQANDRLGPRLWPLGGLHEGVLESWRDPLARAEYVFGCSMYVVSRLRRAFLAYLTIQIVYRSGGHQVIDPPVLPDAGKGRVYLPSWNLHHSLGSLVVGACFDIGQPFPLSSP